MAKVAAAVRVTRLFTNGKDIKYSLLDRKNDLQMLSLVTLHSLLKLKDIQVRVFPLKQLKVSQST
jgi:hypothetical protein